MNNIIIHGHYRQAARGECVIAEWRPNRMSFTENRHLERTGWIMKRNIAVVMFVLLAFCGAALAAPMKVTVSKVTGKVEVSAGAGWKALKDGDSVSVGADVRTGAGASCILKWGGGNAVKLGPLTTMSVDQAEKSVSGDENSRVNLKAGSAQAHAKKLSTSKSSFEIKTPTAVAGVRGTDIIAEIAAGNVSFGVSDGQLEVTAGDQVFVLDDGFLVNVGMDGVFEDPVPIPQDMLEQLKEEFEALKLEAAIPDPVEEPTGDRPGADEILNVIETVNESIDLILDNTVVDEVIDKATGTDFVTGDVSVTIEFESQPY